MRFPRATVLAGALSLGAFEGAAAAAGELAAKAPPRVILRTDGCASRAFDERELIRLLPIELESVGVVTVELAAPGAPIQRAPGGPATAVVSVGGECGASAAALAITIEEPVSGKRVQRSVDFSDTDVSTRSRALALKAAELLRTSWGSIAPSPPPPPPPRNRVLPGLPRSPDPRRVFLSAGVSGRFFLGRSAGLLGGEASAGIPLGPARLLRLQLDGGGWYGTASDDIGRVALALVTGAVGLRVGHDWPSVGIEAGPRAELGWGRASGQTVKSGFDAGAGSRFVAIAAVAATLRVRAWTSVWPTLDVAFGPVLAGFAANALNRTTGEARTITGVSGGAGSARLGVAFAL